MKNTMTVAHNDLQSRESARRRALWKLSAMRPGDPTAHGVLLELEVLDRLDEEGAISSGACPSCRHILALVEVIPHASRKVVNEHSIPSPWRERFAQASVGSTRLATGPYLHDLENFVDEWELEMKHLDAHRKALSRD
ncbi:MULTISPECIES: hypothetical protein [Pseudomonas]|uniref:hypothetical protein n=1 Tax=Pseudomonas TaxID=286 RepID=UPI001E448786|nr:MULTISPECIES: hypothetical protein [Pseudomonas]MCE0952464.1 hypothetical protein [Pseudomonas asiatica]